MPKTYTAAGSATAGQVYTASAHNVIVTNVNNFIVPPAARIRVTGNRAITSAADFAWDGTSYDTDGMWSSGSAARLTAQTAGIYLVVLNVVDQVTVANCTSNSVEIFFNGVAAAGNRSLTTITINEFIITSVSFMASFAVSDYVTARIQFAGGTHTMLNDTRASLSATWVGRTS